MKSGNGWTPSRSAAAIGSDHPARPHGRARGRPRSSAWGKRLRTTVISTIRGRRISATNRRASVQEAIVLDAGDARTEVRGAPRQSQRHHARFRSPSSVRRRPPSIRTAGAPVPSLPDKLEGMLEAPAMKRNPERLSFARWRSGPSSPSTRSRRARRPRRTSRSRSTPCVPPVSPSRWALRPGRRRRERPVLPRPSATPQAAALEAGATRLAVNLVPDDVTDDEAFTEALGPRARPACIAWCSWTMRRERLASFGGFPRWAARGRAGRRSRAGDRSILIEVDHRTHRGGGPASLHDLAVPTSGSARRSARSVTSTTLSRTCWPRVRRTSAGLFRR